MKVKPVINVEEGLVESLEIDNSIFLPLREKIPIEQVSSLIGDATRFLAQVSLEGFDKPYGFARSWTSAEDAIQLLKATKEQKKTVQVIRTSGSEGIRRITLRGKLGSKGNPLPGLILSRRLDALRRKCLTLGYEPVVSEEWHKNDRGLWRTTYKVPKKYEGIIDLWLKA